MLSLEFNKWVIMDKDRKVIAKGVPRSRYLIPVDDENDKKRLLYYDTKGRAESAFKVSGFWNDDWLNPYELEAVPVKIIVEEIQTKGELQNE